MKIKLPQRRCFLYPWLLEQSITLVTGFRGIGKTWFGLGVAKAISTGTSFGPWECKDEAKVLYIDGELPLSDMQDRIAGMGIDLKNENIRFYLDSFAEINDYPRPNLGNPDWREKMLKIFLKEKFDVVFYDNISALTPGVEENKGELWDPISEWLKTCRHRGTSSFLLHHPGKAGDQRGTSKREDNIATSIVLGKPNNYVQDDGARFEIEFTKKRVRNGDLHLIVNRECHLIQNSSGHYEYRWKEPQTELNVLVLRMFNEGVVQKDIAEALKKTPSCISKIKTKLIERKFLKARGTDIKLTPGGADFLMKNDSTFGATA